MIALEEKRVQLQELLQAVEGKLSELHSVIYQPTNEAAPAVKPAATAKPAAKPVAGKKRGRAPRGDRREQIMAALQSAGSKGVTIKEMSASLDIKPALLHAWFSANMKRVSGLKKVGPSHYALNGAAKAPAAAKPEPVAKAPKAAKAAKATKAVKTAKAAKPAKASAGSKRRGAMKDQILAVLQEVGSTGITVKDLAAKLGANYRNVYIWFVTTGKRIAGIKRIAPATYRMEA